MANSDIIKIGFDYRASLAQFEKDTNGVFDGISTKAGKQKIIIQLDAKDDKVIDKIKELQKLKLDKFTFEFGDSGLKEQLQTFDKLENKINEIINLGKGIGSAINGAGNSIVDEKYLKTVIDLFSKIENHTSIIKKVFSDVGDGEEFSPLLKTISNIESAIDNLSSSVKGIGLNMNIDFGSDAEMEARAQAKISNALQAYQNLFDHIKMSSVGGSLITQKFFDFDINQFDTPMSKLQAYVKFIKDMREETKQMFGGQDVLKNDTDAKYWTQASSAMGQVTKVFNEMKTASDVNPLENIFGKTDLSSVIEQLNTIVSKLDEISVSAKGFTETFKNGLNVNASVEEIEKLTNRVKELESELAKVKAPTAVTTPQESNISSGSTTSVIDNQIKKQNEYNDLVAVGYDRIQKMKKISESGTTGSNSVYDLLRLNHEAWDEVKANNFFNTIPEEGLKRYTKILEVVEKIVQEMVQASGLTEEQIVSQLKNIKTAQGGSFKLNGADSGWTHFATYSNGQKDSMQKVNGITYKVYAAFDDIKDLNQNVVSSIMDELTKAGFKGRLKTTSGSTSFGDKLNGLAITDQMVVHGSTKKDQEIAYNTLKNMGLKLSYLGGGIDTPDGSFSQTLASGEINKYIQGLEKEATAARDTARAEQQLAEARKESSTASTEQRKDAFPDSSTNTKSETEGMEQVEKATEEAVQAKKDFATANEGVQSSIDGSENPLKLEAELMGQIAKSAREAAEAKKEFVEANKQVKESANESNSGLKAKPKKDRYAKRRKVSEEDFLNYSPNRVNEKLLNSGYTILGETVNTELVDGLVKVSAKIKDADGAWKSFSAKIDADGNIFEQRFKTVTNGVDKLETALQNFGRETAPALTYQETLDKAQKIKNSLNLGDEYSIKVDSNEFVTITKKLTDVENVGSSVTQTFKSAQDAIDNFGKATSNSAEKTSVALKSVKSNVKEVVDETEKLANSQKEQNTNVNLNGYDKRLDSYNGKIDKYKTTIDRFNDGGWTSNTYLENVQAVKNAVKEYETLLNELKDKDASLVTSEDINRLDNYEKKIKDTIATVTNMSASEKGYNFVSGQKELDKIHKLLNKNSKMSSEAKAKIKAYYREIESGNPSMSLDRIHGEIMKIYNAEVEAGRAGRSFIDTLKNSGFHQFAAQMAGMFSFYDIVNISKEGFNIVRELDTALTEMRKVSDESIQTLKDYQKESFNTADAIATTGLQMQNSIADWQRLGYSIKEANELAKNSNIYKNVGDMDISTATEHMVSSVQAWKSEFNDDAVKTSEEVMNRYNKIGNEFAISSADIGEAMETSAAALKAGGNDLNEALGIITAGNIIQQDASTTSSAMKILSLRIRGAKADLESMGESTDDLADSTSKLREEIKGLTGVDIMADEDTFKSTAEIIKEIGAVWNQLSDVSQAATLEKLAGKNRASTVAGLIENYETIDKVIEAASNADNSALDENQKIIESIDGRIQQLSNRVQEFWYNLVDDSVVKNAVSALTTIVESGTKLIDTFGTLPTLLTAIGAGLSFKNIGKCYVSA